MNFLQLPFYGFCHYLIDLILPLAVLVKKKWRLLVAGFQTLWEPFNLVYQFFVFCVLAGPSPRTKVFCGSCAKAQAMKLVMLSPSLVSGAQAVALIGPHPLDTRQETSDWPVDQKAVVIRWIKGCRLWTKPMMLALRTCPKDGKNQARMATYANGRRICNNLLAKFVSPIALESSVVTMSALGSRWRNFAEMLK